MENYRGQLSVSEQKISELKSSLYDSVTKNEELVASKDKKISVSKNVLISLRIMYSLSINLSKQRKYKVKDQFLLQKNLLKNSLKKIFNAIHKNFLHIL